MEKNSKAKQLLQLFLTFFKIGAFTFGGGYAMISVIERETVDKRKWVTNQDILDMIVIAESTPGVIAVNSATFIGYKICGVLGGIVATFGAVLPSFLIITAISLFFSDFRENQYVNAAFKGVRCAVAVLILNAVSSLAKPMKKNAFTVMVAVAAFLAATFLDFDVIWLILVGGIIGIVLSAVKAAKAHKANAANNCDRAASDIGGASGEKEKHGASGEQARSDSDGEQTRSGEEENRGAVNEKDKSGGKKAEGEGADGGQNGGKV